MKEKLLLYLQQFVTERRLNQMNQVLSERTRHITVALEDIYQSHNASAVLRSCECFGIQDVHIIENQNPYQVNPDVALGSSKWLTLYRYNQAEHNTKTAIDNLKQKGYQVVAATPELNAQPIEEFDVTTGKVALLFGTEMNGLSDEALGLSDSCVKIPMYGFTQSFNISVAAAVIIHQFVSRLHESNISWQLREDEKINLKIQWLKSRLKRPDVIERYISDNFKFDSAEE